MIVRFGVCTAEMKLFDSMARKTTHTRSVVFNLGSADNFKGAAKVKGSTKVLKVSLKIMQFIEVPVFINHY